MNLAYVASPSAILSPREGIVIASPPRRTWQSGAGVSPYAESVISSQVLRSAATKNLSPALSAKLRFRNLAAFHEAPQRPQRQRVPAVRRHDYWVSGFWMPPLLMTAPLRGNDKVMAAEDSSNLVSVEPGYPQPRHQAATSTSKTFPSGLTATNVGSK